jgi:sigma-B regulation protein RsbU (phosphoserine phosphatase)
VVRAAGRVEQIGEPGAALGLFPDSPLADREIVLRTGDLAVFFTDGVTEARSPDGGEFGEDRLRDLLGSLAGAAADQVAAAVEGEALAFGRGVAADDIAVLVIRVSPVPDGTHLSLS